MNRNRTARHRHRTKRCLYSSTAKLLSVIIVLNIPLVSCLQGASNLSHARSPNPRCVRRADPPILLGVAAAGKTLNTQLSSFQYGKGSEIWPECNEEPMQLASSFPGGIIPKAASDLLANTAPSPAPESGSSVDLNKYDDETLQPKGARGRRRRAVRRSLSRLLRSAAIASSQRAEESTGTEYFRTYGMPAPAVDKGPAIVAVALVLCGMVDIKHVAGVLGLSLYFLALEGWCAAPSAGTSSLTSGECVNMPSLPPRGHAPNLVSNPLGSSLTNSFAYRTWLRMGALLGLLLPAAAVGWYRLRWNDVAAATAVAGPMFLLCCQALSEAVARTAMAPLPIRILVPVSYNALRLGALYSWTMFSSPLGVAGRVLAASNLIYWFANLFGFLIPVGVVRYLRAHFFCVEAVEVTVREGGEKSIGLLP